MKLQIIKANANNNQFIVLLKKQLPNDFKINDSVIKKICKQHNVGLQIWTQFRYVIHIVCIWLICL